MAIRQLWVTPTPHESFSFQFCLNKQAIARKGPGKWSQTKQQLLCAVSWRFAAPSQPEPTSISKPVTKIKQWANLSPSMKLHFQLNRVFFIWRSDGDQAALSHAKASWKLQFCLNKQAIARKGPGKWSKTKQQLLCAVSWRFAAPSQPEPTSISKTVTKIKQWTNLSQSMKLHFQLNLVFFIWRSYGDQAAVSHANASWKLQFWVLSEQTSHC